LAFSTCAGRLVVLAADDDGERLPRFHLRIVGHVGSDFNVFPVEIFLVTVVRRLENSLNRIV
jgi:hypothetical protein